MLSRVQYVYHSGFSVDLGDQLLLFDRIPHADAPVEPFDMPRTYFVSHAHGDHFSESIYKRANKRTQYVLSDDIPTTHSGHRIAPGETLRLGDLTVCALPSTDLGVAFWVQVGGTKPQTIFHAGDLNWWHWRDESTAAEIEQAEIDFKAALRQMPSGEIDIAFFPVDPRQGSMYDVGAAYFAAEFRPRFLFPMHFQQRSSTATEFARRTREKGVTVVALTQPGQTYDIPERE